jgi:hypothetical protein
MLVRCQPPEFIMKEIIRIGECNRCGKCCRDCMYLTKFNLCYVYGDRPDWCIQEFPRNKEDLIVRGIEQTCGYTFVELGNYKI